MSQAEGFDHLNPNTDDSVDVSGGDPTAVDSDSRIGYRANVEAAVWRRWGDELAVYECRAARTHLLADGHAEVFGLLAARRESLTLADIAREFEDENEDENAREDARDVTKPQPLSDAELESLRSLVQELVSLGLVESTVPR